MKGYAIDASALLALVFREKGADYVRARLPLCRISAVNLAEVASRLSDRGMPEVEAAELIHATGVDCVPFDARQALVSASVRRKTRAFGLSPGDRACLALAGTGKLTALTADRIWTDAGPMAGVDVDLISGRG